MKFSRTRLTVAALISLAAVALSGCGKPASLAPSSVEITLKEIDAAGLAEAIERHRGKVVLVDFWATWCGPCVALFPHTVELRNRYSPDELAVITVSMDKRDTRDSVLRFLRRHEANTENYLNTIESDAEAFEAFNIPGGIPHLLVYDRSGKIFRTIEGNRPDEIDRAVAELLEKGKSSGVEKAQ